MAYEAEERLLREKDQQRLGFREEALARLSRFQSVASSGLRRDSQRREGRGGEKREKRTSKVILSESKVPQAQRRVARRALVLLVQLLVALSNLSIPGAVAVLHVDEA